MSNLILYIPSIPGESTLATPAIKEAGGTGGGIPCSTLRHTIDLPVISTGSDRTEGSAKHGAVELRKGIDKATPHLRYAASTGSCVGTVTIERMRTSAGTSVAELITLENTYVVRHDLDTAFDAATLEPSNDFVEIISLEYSKITWKYTPFINNVAQSAVQKSYDVSTQTAA